MNKSSDGLPLDRALTAADKLKRGSWESVEALGLLAIEAVGKPQSVELVDAARSTADGLKAGTWESVRALAWLARAERELSND